MENNDLPLIVWQRCKRKSKIPLGRKIPVRWREPGRLIGKLDVAQTCFHVVQNGITHAS